MDADTIVGEGETFQHDQLLILLREAEKLDRAVDDLGGLMIGVKADSDDTNANVDQPIERLAAVEREVRTLLITATEMVEAT